jgi:hypothetical protein
VKADIYFGDAAHMRSDHHAGRTCRARRTCLASDLLYGPSSTVRAGRRGVSH